MPTPLRPSLIAKAAALGALLAAHLGASSYIMTTDDELLEQAPVVAMGRVLSVGSAPELGRQPATDYQLDIESVLKGFIPASTVVVRVPGGVSAEGVATLTWGDPIFSVDERVLLFLEPDATGTFRILQSYLGAFHELQVGERSFWVRRLTQTHEVAAADAAKEQRAKAHLPRDRDAFLAWLLTRAEGLEATDEYFATEATEAIEKAATELPLVPPSLCGTASRGVRWPDAGDGVVVPLVHDLRGQVDLLGRGVAELRAALKLWNDDPKTPLRLRFRGERRIRAKADGLSSILGGDPYNEIPGSFVGSGVLSATTLRFDCDITDRHNGELFHRALEADIVTQDNLDLLFADGADGSRAYTRLLAHEIGHLLGLGHTCGERGLPACVDDLAEALMRPLADSDSGELRLAESDRAALASLYAEIDAEALPKAPSELEAVATSPYEIRLSWRDNSPDETGFVLEESDGLGPFAELVTLEADSTEISVVGVPPGGERLYRVRAIRDPRAFSPYSNEASATTPTRGGSCVANDTTLCLMEDRFRITVRYTTPEGFKGRGQAVKLGEKEGHFWFFRDNQVEVMVRVTEACASATGPGYFGLFAGGLTDGLEVELTVTDTQGRSVPKVYRSALGMPFKSIRDTEAFPCH